VKLPTVLSAICPHPAERYNMGLDAKNEGRRLVTEARFHESTIAARGSNPCRRDPAPSTSVVRHYDGQ